MAFHVFGHIEADQFDAEDLCQLAAELGFADAGGAGEEEAADGLLRLFEAGAGEFDGIGEGGDRRVLAEYHHAQAFF